MGLLSAAAAILGAVAGGLGTYFAADNQASTAVGQANFEYRRDQQQANYADLLATYDRVTDAGNGLMLYYSSVADGVPVPPGPSNTDFVKQLIDAQSEQNQLISMSRIVGTDDMETKINEVSAAIGEVRNMLVDVELLRNDPQNQERFLPANEGKDLRGVVDNLIASINKVSSAKEAFITQAQTDLGFKEEGK
ncbi:hypothetical protein [Mycolicibacterium neoaurum]|uniref:hypothetical protein n=1 Tax=Mycolicibacterium neoaurum TaxID=1795 RepID=UPI001F4CB9AF|nr:hypothetical protein [Mycolicibacterium neoaurum]